MSLLYDFKIFSNPDFDGSNITYTTRNSKYLLYSADKHGLSKLKSSAFSHISEFAFSNIESNQSVVATLFCQKFRSKDSHRQIIFQNDDKLQFFNNTINLTPEQFDNATSLNATFFLPVTFSRMNFFIISSRNFPGKTLTLAEPTDPNINLFNPETFEKIEFFQSKFESFSTNTKDYLIMRDFWPGNYKHTPRVYDFSRINIDLDWLFSVNKNSYENRNIIRYVIKNNMELEQLKDLKQCYMDKVNDWIIDFTSRPTTNRHNSRLSIPQLGLLNITR